MRIFVAALLMASLASSAFAAAPTAQAAFVERSGLLQLDAQCQLFTPDIHAALESSALQARGALMRGGWNNAQLNDLEQIAINAARTRTCDDPRTIKAAADARTAYAAWARAITMAFPGQFRTWTARRFADINGLRLEQEIATGVHFGVRDHNGGQALSLLMPLSAGQPATATATLVLRDRASAPGGPQSFQASTRRIEPADRFHPQMLVFEFAPAAFQALLALDPREAVDVQLPRNGAIQRLQIEVGDLVAARLFLVAHAS